MEYRLLGKTGLKVSCLSMGTVELGMDYGIREAGESNRPDRKEALYLLQYAADRGINLFDTAPGYGISEELIGEAIGTNQNCYIATKVSKPTVDRKMLTGEMLLRTVNTSLENSLRTLRCETIDIVQIHNATVEIIKQGEMTEVLKRARESGKIRFIGASVYGEEAALTAINSGYFDVIQVAYSLLDQRMALNVLPSARAAGVGIINRSALLKGALTYRAKWLPDELSLLRQASERIINTFGISWDTLPEIALRFCLSSEFVHTVLVGVISKQELDIAISTASKGALDKDKLKMKADFALQNESLLNPSYWSIP